VAGPLAGVKVLEIASIVLGPLAGQYLGDLGADVIKIEPPEGDLTRVQGPRRSDHMSAFFLTCNRNKRSVVLDLKTPEAREILHTLVKGTDVVIHSIRTQAARKIGLTYQSLSQLNPKLILCHVKGFSDDGEYAGKPAYDDIIQGLSGLASLQASVAGEPRYVPSVIPDKLTGVHAAMAVIAALYHRLATGHGQEINVPMFETMTYFNMIEHLWGGVFEPRQSLGYPAIAKAARRPFKTSDGYLAFLPHTDAHWRRFLTSIERTDLIDDPQFRSFAARQENWKAVWDFVRDEIAKRSSAEWISLLKDDDLPIAIVNSLEDLLDDPHLDSIGFWSIQQHSSEGTLRMPRNPLDMRGSPPDIHRLPPQLGEHTEEVLHEFGCSEEQIRNSTEKVRGNVADQAVG
jgi:crotonobetainyl-CoA:carnitine CoA-transferase CaiB-like acyl-CoA transferase